MALIKPRPVLCPYSGEKGHPAVQLLIYELEGKTTADVKLCDYCDAMELWPTKKRKPKPKS